MLLQSHRRISFTSTADLFLRVAVECEDIKQTSRSLDRNVLRMREGSAMAQSRVTAIAPNRFFRNTLIFLISPLAARTISIACNSGLRRVEKGNDQFRVALLAADLL